VTSGTIFASRKLPIRDYLMAIAVFVNGAKGHGFAAKPRSMRPVQNGVRAQPQASRSRRGRD
jgi:hypothetical protein